MKESKNLLIQIVINLVLFPLVWILLDLLYCSLITHRPFTFTVQEHILRPMGVAVTYMLVKWLFQRIRKQ